MSTPLPRRFGLLQATALNMINMIGIGPFITIPLLMTALGGPQAMLGWIVALVIVICDGMVWSELGAAMPGSGGSFGYLREAFGRETFGRLMAFLFVWQFILSGPLEIASGYIGFSQYLGYIWPGFSRRLAVPGRRRRRPAQHRAALPAHHVDRDDHRQPVGRHAADDGRRDRDRRDALRSADRVRLSAGRVQLLARVPDGPRRRVARRRLRLPRLLRRVLHRRRGREPGRVIPRSILISTVAVAAIYFGINLSIIGVVPWREFVPADAHPQSSFIVSTFMERIYGSRVATVFTLMILWTAFGSVFALLLGYSRIPYAAARDGYFFKAFARLHPTKGFPTSR